MWLLDRRSYLLFRDTKYTSFISAQKNAMVVAHRAKAVIEDRAKLLLLLSVILGQREARETYDIGDGIRQW